MSSSWQGRTQKKKEKPLGEDSRVVFSRKTFNIKRKKMVMARAAYKSDFQMMREVFQLEKLNMKTKPHFEQRTKDALMEGFGW